MNYEDSFFTSYRRYLDDPRVQTTHRDIFNLFAIQCPLIHLGGLVVDFGCGTAEFGRYLYDANPSIATYPDYVGIDLDISRVDCPGGNFEVADYTNYQIPPDTIAAVSLFATEIHLPLDQREALYDKWLSAGVGAILVSGFYYLYCPNANTMREESTGITVFQTPLSTPLRSGEYRITTTIPPGMFVDPFIEVWRLIKP